MKQPLVSVIVTTKNNHVTLAACLESIKWQDYSHVELIVVDNYSADDTKTIAQKYTSHVYDKGPERCTQRNFAVSVAAGTYIAIIDSDMELSPHVIRDCVATIQTHSKIKGIVIPEESFGKGFWAQCKQLERSFYVGVDWIEAARFYDKETYQAVGGYDETLVSGEDWDLSRRIGTEGDIGRISAFIYHNEGHINLWKTLKKKYYYAKFAKAYLTKNPVSSKLSAQVGPLQRYKLFFAQPVRLFKHPLHGVGMLFMKTCEFGAGAAGYVSAGKEGEALRG